MIPVFSNENIRGLVDVFNPIAQEVCIYNTVVTEVGLNSPCRFFVELKDALTMQVRGGQEELDILEWTSRFALECIGQGGLGHSFHSLDETRVDEYGDSVRMLMYVRFRTFLHRRRSK